MIELSRLKQLLEHRDKPLLSLYIRVDPALPENQALTPAWQIWVKNTLREMNNTMQDEQVTSWARALSHVLAFLDDYRPDAKGLILFADEDGLQDYRLPVLPQENVAHFGAPLVAPLLWLMDEYERYLIVLVDEEEAHFLTTYLGTIGREEAMASDRFSFDFREKTIRARDARPGGGINQDALDDLTDELISRFHRDVATHISGVMARTGALRVIIGGHERAAHAVRALLPVSVASALVGVIQIPFEESDQEVMARVLPLALDYERRKEAELVTSVIAQARAGGRGALGLDAVRQALALGQVDTLIAPWPTDDLELLHHLTLHAMQVGARVELVHGQAADMLRGTGSVAALLRFTL